MPCTTTYTYSSANPRIQTKILGKGTYNIMVQGGAGGIGHWNACGCCTQSGGQGATEQAAFYLATQTTVSFVVGGDGLRGNCAGGGGGASVVWIRSYTNPLIEAGGGGGGGWSGIGGCATLASGLGSTHASSGQSFNCGCTFSSGATGGTGGAGQR